MEKVNEQAYRQKLIDMGLSADTAHDVARKYAENQKASLAKSPQSFQIHQAADELATGMALEAAEKNTKKNPSKDSPTAKAKAPAVIPAPTKKKERKAPLTRQERELIGAGVTIETEEPGNNDLTFMHSIMCQIGLPRSKVDGLEFERTCGGAGLYVRAGKLWDGKQFIQQPIPYGPMPRLVMAYLNTQALRFKSPEIEVGNSASAFLKQLGKDATGGKTGSYTNFRKQIMALSACSMTLGFTTAAKAITYDGKPIQRFEAWIGNQDDQGALWPGVITFSQEYYDTLTDHAVPLDLRALNALTGSALAMDIYAMLADRLHRISGRPLVLYWRNLREQFGQEYSGPEADKNFKKKFLPALQKVLAVYPEAKVKQVAGGLLMMPSPPPIPYRYPKA